MEHRDDIVCRVPASLGLQHANHLFQSGGIPFQTIADAAQGVVTDAIDNDGLCLSIPLIRKDFVVRIQLPDHPVVDDLKIKTSLFTIYRGRPEFDLYGCHDD